MSAPQFALLGTRRLGPLFAVQFLTAFNDNLFKFALLFLATYTVHAGEPDKAAMLALIATGLFTLPYFLFGAIAGELSDAWDKARLIRWVKLAEVGIMALGLVGFWVQSIPMLLGALFLMGCHSTIFGPAKYAIIPQHLREDEVMGGTGLIEAGTFLAILSGQLMAGLVPPWEAGLVATGLALVGYAAALAIPAAPSSVPGLKIDINPIRATRKLMHVPGNGEGVWLCILGISWFFAVGAVMLSQFTPLVDGVLRGDPSVANLCLIVFSVAVALGSVTVNKLLKGEISGRYVPISALILAAFMIDLWIATSSFVPGMDVSDWRSFAASGAALRILFDLFMIAFAAGMFVVPLYAILQTSGPPEERSRRIAANNIVNAAIGVAVIGGIAGLVAGGMTVPGIIGAMGFATLAVALISCWLLPETVIKALAAAILRILYRVEIKGAEHMPKAGDPAVVVVNHVSFLDGLLLAAFLQGKPTFAVHSAVAKKWWMRIAMKLFRAFPVDPTNPMAAKAMVKTVKAGNTLVIFPEGRLTVTGALMKVFDGPGMVADKADAPIIPVRIDGAQYSRFSRLKGKVRLRPFPKIRLTVLPPRRFALPEGLTARARRAVAGRKLYDVMSAMIFETSNIDRTLYEALLDARDVHGGKAKVVEDIKRQPLTYKKLIVGTKALGRALKKRTAQGENVGLLLPNISGTVVTFFALQGLGRVPAMLNYTAGPANLKAACAAAEVKTIVTARAFVEQGKLEPLIAALEADGLGFVYLEDVAATIGTGAKIRALIGASFARRLLKRRKLSPDAPAVILFTSGSEGVPKGVVLTHRNLLSNCAQLAARIDFNASDVVLNALPVFHSFGLTGGTLLPLFNGLRVFLYPNPLHYRIVPAVAYDANATILFGTDTFLSGYARMAHSYDFYALRYIFAGAERVRDETRKTFAEKFGLRIMEGYGVTETSPVLAVNTPMHFKAGTVGRALPGIELKLEEVPGIDNGQRLFVRGPNVMAGYLKADAPGVLQPPEDGWHDTGDIVAVDGEGFIAIKGRAKRFAKIAGEMVSLPAVEGYAAALWPDADHAVVTRPDPKKGEQLVLFTTEKLAKASALQAWAKANGIAELAVPKGVRVIDALPVLGTGKVDYVTLGAMAA